MSVYADIFFDIGLDIEEKTSISVAKEDQIGASFAYQVRYRRFFLRYRSHDINIWLAKGVGLDRLSLASMSVTISYLISMFFYLISKLDFDVYDLRYHSASTSISQSNYYKALRYLSLDTSILMSRLRYCIRYWL
jgi:hypothetical protein